jgi:hypothetical protein
MNPHQITEMRTTASGVSRTIEVLMSRLIDYAGLFPPAGPGMLPAVTNYDSYLHGQFAWMLGRFIVPAGRLDEFDVALARLPGDCSKTWGLSVLLGSDPAADVDRILTFNARPKHSNGARHAAVESVEVKVDTPEDVGRLAPLIPRELATFFEIPRNGRERECLAAVAASGRGAKIRTGGETPDKFPNANQVVDFMRLCAVNHVPFKATAGLHHPLRSEHRLTDSPGSPSGTMHGFLNVFLAAAFLRSGMEASSAAQLLEERSAPAIRFEPDGVVWRQHRLAEENIAAARRDFSISFGSCSFTEPVDGLKSLGLL